MSENTPKFKARIGFGDTSLGELPVIPLRLVVVADLAPEGSSFDFTARQPLRVDKDSFNDVLREVCPRVAFHIEDAASTNGYASIEFTVEDLKSFQPATLVREVEPLRKMLEGRQSLVDLRDQKISREQFLEKMEVSSFPMLSPEAFSRALRNAPAPATRQASPAAPKPAPAPASRDEGALDAILDMVDAPSEAREAPVESTQGAARVQQFISDMFSGRGARDTADKRALNDLIAEIDKALSDKVNDVMCNAQFARLEASWRSLKFLVDRTDLREPIYIEVVPAGKEQLPEVLHALLEESEAAEVPPAVVLTGFGFVNSPPDMVLLKECAELAEQLHAPLLVNVGAAFFGMRDASEAAGIPLLQSHLESPEFVKWAAFRQCEASRWVGVCFNRFLLRGPYDESSASKLPFRFKARGDGLWCEPSWAIGSLLTRSFARSGWCGHITGIRAGGAIEDLPVRANRLPSGGETQIPLETIFSKDRERDFYEAGFMILQTGENQDKAVLLQAPSAHCPEIYSDERETEAGRWRSMLPYQLVASQLIRHLIPVLQEMRTSGSPLEMEGSIDRRLRALMRQSGASETESVQVSIRASEDRSDSNDMLIRIRPGFAIWSLPAETELALNLQI